MSLHAVFIYTILLNDKLSSFHFSASKYVSFTGKYYTFDKGKTIVRSSDPRLLNTAACTGPLLSKYINGFPLHLKISAMHLYSCYSTIQNYK